MRLRPPETLKLDTPGLHNSALCNLEQMWNDVLALMRQIRHSLMILDFGSGHEGVSRSQLPYKLRNFDNLHLFDKETITKPPIDFGVSVVQSSNIYGHTRAIYDLINISYVLCLMEPEQATETLERLRQEQHEAVVAVADYTLQTFPPGDFLGTFNCNLERKWCEAHGHNKFYRTRARFSPQSLAELVRDAGYVVAEKEAQPLDAKGHRGAVIAYPSQSIKDQYISPGANDKRYPIPDLSQFINP
ncbi:MAG: hypothetical protein QF755_01300 [Candidatus Peribacteraceae bacterium]|jgi:hypothetical protein|nr:hypothetical protein [Candidatus Peribacteraceae bacterium]HCI03454.1 hypothetical protein [Candidatus Peribacteria bacterium]|tara:strand:+ start:70 stop:804 length:735 start_codon:yes stop_codon:yes gene_type:complete